MDSPTRIKRAAASRVILSEAPTTHRHPIPTLVTPQPCGRDYARCSFLWAGEDFERCSKRRAF
jgi:hypothetical protein